MMERKLTLFRCICPGKQTHQPEVRVKRAGRWYHCYIYHKDCGNLEFLFKFAVARYENLAAFEVTPIDIEEYKNVSPIPSDFLRGGEGKEPLLAEEYAEQATKQLEKDLDNEDDPDLNRDMADWGCPDP